MSGHSKWSTIKRQKGAADQKRGQAFSKLSNAITIAVKQGGGITDPESNFKLRLAVDKAKAANMPKDNIDRAIAKGAGAGDGIVLEEVVYEGFAPGGVAIIVEAVTDKNQRTVAEVKNIFDKNGGSFGNPGSVAYLFSHMGELVVQKNGKSMDEILNIALELGAEDVEEEGESVVISTSVTDFQAVKKGIESAGLVIENAEIVYKPNTTIEVSDTQVQNRVMNLLEKLEEHDDVQSVYSNADFVQQ